MFFNHSQVFFVQSKATRASERLSNVANDPRNGFIWGGLGNDGNFRYCALMYIHTILSIHDTGRSSPKLKREVCVLLCKFNKDVVHVH